MDARLSFVGRQLARLLTTERDQDSALRRIEQTLHPSFKPALISLRDALARPELELRGDPQTDSPRIAARVMRTLREQGGRPSEDVWAALERQQVALSISLQTSARHFTSALLISLATALIACIVGLVYVIFVLPQFASLYATSGTELPEMTRALLATGYLWLIAVPLILVLMLGLALAGQVSVGPFRWSKRMNLLSRWSLFGRDIGRRYRQLLFLIYARGLVSGGLGHQQALSLAAREIGLDKKTETTTLGSGASGSDAASLMMHALSSADATGFLPQEIDAQWLTQNAELVAAAQQQQARVGMIIRTVLYLGVAALVIAMYLPIFKLGAAF